MAILEKIHSHDDLVKLTESDRRELCSEIRDFLISHISKTGGHLASNLGVVELTVAIETVFDTEKDRLVFDVGHQSYVHKMLTNRQADFNALRQFGGIAGFPKPSESHTDAFIAGHASSSVSIGLGMARARTAFNQDYNVISLLGDGAATGGLAYEGLNDAAVSGEPMIIILNDNAMSIDRNVGGMAYHLRNLRAKPKYIGMKNSYKRFLNRIPGGKLFYKITKSVKEWARRILIPPTIFESMGFTYLGPADGHDTENLIELLHNAKALNEPVVLHVITHKGHGYEPAEKNPRKFHGIGKFEPETGDTIGSESFTFSQAFGQQMLQLAAENNKVCAITAAMPAGTGLLPFMQQYPQRLFDVGIAEEHAVSMAGGLAKQGLIPVVAIYSTFLQRSFDMILHDVCMLNNHIILAIDRAGIVGEDGETHHGLYDVGFLRQAPNLTILCPGSCNELRMMLSWAVSEQDGPVAIRYPRGGDRSFTDSAWSTNDPLQKLVYRHRSGDDVTIITYGTMYENAIDASRLLHDKGIEASVLRMLAVSPLPVEEIISMKSSASRIFIVEEACSSGVKQDLAWEIRKRLPECMVSGIDFGRRFVTHGSVADLYQHYGLDGQHIAQTIMEEFFHES